MITYGKAGGFANAAFRARHAQRASASRSLGATAGAKGRNRPNKAVRRAAAIGTGAAFVAIGVAATRTRVR